MGSFFSSAAKVAVDMDGEKAKFVKDAISNNKIVIFSKSYCPYCNMAKDQFKKLNAQYNAIELDKRDDCNELQNILGEITGARSVPRVFIDGTFIGGGTDVKKLYENGSLEKMLN